MTRFWPSRVLLSPPTVDTADIDSVVRALDSGWLAPAGPELTAFETEVARTVGVNHAVAMSSGTAALHLGLKYLGVSPGDHVLIPTVTFGATAFAVTYLGAVPVFVDIDQSWNMDPECVVFAIDELRSRGIRVGAAIPVDLYGNLADYSSLVPLFSELNIPMLEDAAEALGSYSGSRAAGSFGQAAVVSFNGNKIITTSGGGMLLTGSADMAEKVRFWSTQAREDLPWYEHQEIGYNYRLSNLLAALGRSQLRRLESEFVKRRQIREWYRDRLENTRGVSVQSDSAWGVSNSWLTVVRFDRRRFPDAPTRVRTLLELHDVESRPVWKPLHQQPVFREARSFLTGAADVLFQEGLCLPSGSRLTENDVDRISSLVLSALSSN